MQGWVVKWRGPQGQGRAHDAAHEGRLYASRDEAERVAERFRRNDRAHTYWVERVAP